MSQPESSSASYCEELAVQDAEYHVRQFHHPYRSTAHLTNFIRENVPIRTGEAIDVACGAGANIYHLSQEFGKFRWNGIDIAGRALFPLAETYFRERPIKPALHVGDFYQLRDRFGEKSFDLVLSIQTLLTLPSYEALLDQLLAITRGWLVVTSLFTDFDVDVRSQVFDYTWPDRVSGPHYYSTFSLRRFEQFCIARGTDHLIVKDFDIDSDLPMPTSNAGFKTYTRTLEDGKRLQFTGPIYQPWKFVAVHVL